MAAKKSTTATSTEKILKALKGLSPVEAVALTKFAIGNDELVGKVIDLVDPGAYPIDFVVKVSGILVKNQDHYKTPTGNIPWLYALALFVYRAGITRKKSVKLLFNVLKESMELNKETEEVRQQLLEETGVKEAMDMLKSYLMTLPKVKAKGHISKRYGFELVKR